MIKLRIALLDNTVETRIGAKAFLETQTGRKVAAILGSSSDDEVHLLAAAPLMQHALKEVQEGDDFEELAGPTQMLILETLSASEPPKPPKPRQALATLVAMLSSRDFIVQGPQLNKALEDAAASLKHWKE